MQTFVAMTAFTSLNKFMRREVWHLADGPELNNVQQTSRASTLILITEQTTWLQSDALMKTFTSFLGFTPPESSDLRERNVCIVCVARNTKVSQGSINLFIDYYRSKVLPPFNSSYLIRTSPPPKKEENFIGNEWIRKTRRGWIVLRTISNAINSPYFTPPLAAWSILHQEWNRPKRRQPCVIIEGERIVIPTRLDHVKWARILSTYGLCHPSWAEPDFRLLSLQGLAARRG